MEQSPPWPSVVLLATSKSIADAAQSALTRANISCQIVLLLGYTDATDYVTTSIGPLPLDLGKTIRRLRKARRMSQRELGRLAELDYTYVCKIETKGLIPSRTALRRIMSALEVVPP